MTAGQGPADPPASPSGQEPAAQAVAGQNASAGDDATRPSAGAPGADHGAGAAGAGATRAAAPGWRARCRSWRRGLAHSIKLQMVLVFLVLAVVLCGVFVVSVHRVFMVGWREAAQPLLGDYLDRMAEDLMVDERLDVARAQALTRRLPLTLCVCDGDGQVHWSSHAALQGRCQRFCAASVSGHADVFAGAGPAGEPCEAPGPGAGEPGLLTRRLADGHILQFGLDEQVFGGPPVRLGGVLAVVLGLILAAWLYARHLLRPLEGINATVARFGAGDFSAGPAPSGKREDELTALARCLDQMGQDIKHLLDAKRALLLAVSHELRSPLTRARLHAELLPETPEVLPQRDALQHDLREMTTLVEDLLERERLSGSHVALVRTSVTLPALVAEVLAALQSRHPEAASVRVHAAPGLPALTLDAARIRLMLRNVLDNALRHGGSSPGATGNAGAAAGAEQAGAAATAGPRPDPGPVEVHITPRDGGVQLVVRDHGPGVSAELLQRLTEPFFRPDAARLRRTGGVGLGLHLALLVAQAHGGQLQLRLARPGLAVDIWLPADGPRR